MGHRKRAPPSNRKPDSPSPATPNFPAKVEYPSNKPSMKQECERALASLRRGNHNKALRLIKESTAKFDNSALFHRVAGTINVKVAGIIDDPTVKRRHLKNAIESAKKAKTLSPNSIEYAHFYANLLLEASTDARDCKEVVAECERALELENPNDPAKDELSGLERDETVSFSTKAKEARVSLLKSELRGLIQQVNVASLTSWVKNLSPKDDSTEYQLFSVPLRCAEDPVEVKYLNVNGNRRQNEIKKANKTPEQRRQEIEVRVAAARLLQQKNEQAGEESSGVFLLNNGSAAAYGSGRAKAGERRRHGGSRRSTSTSEWKDKIRPFWNTMSSEMKKGLLSIRVSDLTAHFDGLTNKNGSQACGVLSEALAFGRMNQSWKFWACCRCGERFTDFDAHMQHVIQEHLGILLPQLQSVLPLSIDSEWEQMLLSCSWKPLDLTASVRMLEDQSKPEVSDFSDRDNSKEQTDGCWNDNYNNSFVENGGDDVKLDTECKTCDRKGEYKMYDHNNSWPLSDDTEREKLLEKISSLFQVLLRQKCLAMAHLQKVIQCAVEELQGLFPDLQILSCCLDQTPLCMCFLGARPLEKIVDFLQNMSYSCGFGRYPGKISVENTIAHPQVLDCEYEIMLNESASSLQLDESLLHFNDVRDDVCSGDYIGGFGKGAQSDSDPLLSWICASSSSTEQLATWSRIREEKSQEGMQVLDMFGKEFIQLQTLCERKHELLGYEEALQRLLELCMEECKERELASGISHHSYDSILRKRRDGLLEGYNEDVYVSNRLELDAISAVLKEAESLHVSQYGYEDTYGGVASHICDLEAGEEDWRSKDYLHQLDSCTEIILQRQKEHVNLELSKVDAQIMRKLANTKQLELKLELVSVLDYRFILLPLVKSFMQAHLEHLAEKDATEKSDAAREAFLAELDLDSKKCKGRGNDNGKTPQERMKDRKTNKDSTRSKDSKLGSFNDQLEAAEQYSLSSNSDGELDDDNILEPKSNGNIKELEDEFRQKLELEAEERKLEESLDYQRQLEKEAKQRLLDEQLKRNAQVSFDDALGRTGDVQVGISGTPCCKQVALPCKNDNADSVNSSLKMRDDTNSGFADDESVGIANRCVRPGLPNVDGISDEVLPLERQAEKRRKWINSSKSPADKYQTVSYGTEYVKLEKLTTDIGQKYKVWNPNGSLDQSGDGRLKTLRQLQPEEDEEERFQADLKKAVTQSLACQKMSVVSNSTNGHKRSQDFESFGTKADGVTCENVNANLVGLGLQNEVGEYNCYLNVIIQSLWHLRQFREEFLMRSASEHVHVGDPCVVCALFNILTALSRACLDANREAVTPSMFRIALSNLYPESNFFEEGQMNDASEVLEVIFECLHQSFMPGVGGSDSDSVESNSKGSWDCSSQSCIVHTLFGMDVFERMNCFNCGLESRHLKYTSFFHNINATALRTLKVMCMDLSFDELLNLMETNHQLACDPEARGCGKPNHIHHILSKPPNIFTTVIGWQNTSENIDDIKSTLAALSTEIDISIFYRGLDPQNPYRLAVVVCYYGQHYHCFAYSHVHEKWIMYDDKTVKVIGTWEDVVSMCERGHLQPQVLFYETVN